MMNGNPLFSFTDEERDFLREGLQDQEDRLSPYAVRDADAVMEHPEDSVADMDRDLVRPAFTRDVDRILNNPFYNRSADKTQVFSLYRNDDITRRSLHQQLVAQTARKIGRALRLNEALIEAIGLGHDAGHTPFGHRGEKMLSNLYHDHAGRYFNHNVHSVRALRDVGGMELSLQTLHGIICHCGEKAFCAYYPGECADFDEFNALVEKCYIDESNIADLRPNTLEGCVVRISDILAYVGKDRQDAISAHVIEPHEYEVTANILGQTNREILQNATANIVKMSMGKDHLAMSPEVFEALVALKDLNSKYIYKCEKVAVLDDVIRPMMEELYERLRDDLVAGREESPIWRHHLNAWFLRNNAAYRESPVDDIVVDYIASMTDDYFIDLYRYLFPDDPKAQKEIYRPYFTH